VVVEISGTRRTLIFKLMNSSHVVALIMRPQATRGGGSNISFLPSMMEEFMGGCEDVAAFENLVTSEEESFPASQLWQQAQSFWLCLMIFKILEGNLLQRATSSLALIVT
jgi:hypothetical protein